MERDPRPAQGPIPAGPPLTGNASHAPYSYVTAANSRGDFVTGDLGNVQHLRTAEGAYVPLRGEMTDWNHAGQAVDRDGTVAFTSERDGLVRFLRCH